MFQSWVSGEPDGRYVFQQRRPRNEREKDEFVPTPGPMHMWVPLTEMFSTQFLYEILGDLQLPHICDLCDPACLLTSIGPVT